MPPPLKDWVRFDAAVATHDRFGGAVKSCLAGGGRGDVIIWLILVGATHDVSSAISSHVCCYSFKGGAIVAGGVAVWDVIGLQFLLR